MNATIGTKMKLVHGYKGLNDTFLAMERGELDGYPGVYYSALSSTRPNWLPDKQAKAILQIGPEKAAGIAQRAGRAGFRQKSRRPAVGAGGGRHPGAWAAAGHDAGRSGRPGRRHAQGAGRYLCRSGLPG